MLYIQLTDPTESQDHLATYYYDMRKAMLLIMQSSAFWRHAHACLRECWNTGNPLTARAAGYSSVKTTFHSCKWERKKKNTKKVLKNNVLNLHFITEYENKMWNKLSHIGATLNHSGTSIYLLWRQIKIFCCCLNSNNRCFELETLTEVSL